MSVEDESYQKPATFAELGVCEQIIQALDAHGITAPFPIQTLAIPIALSGGDLIGQARTGTGKTFAYGLPVLEHLKGEEIDAYGKPQALIMTPTRELALQVAQDLKTAAEGSSVRILTVYGGVPYEEQTAPLRRGVDVVVGTPGRLLDLVSRKQLDLSHVSTWVLDEADEMLNLGFLPDVERIGSMLPEKRQTMLFSATMPQQIVALSRNYLKQPVHVRAEGEDAQATVPDTTQFVYQAHDLDKPEIIGKLLQAPEVKKVMVFTQTKRAASRLTDELVDRGFSAGAIHGDLNQAQRERTLKKFRGDGYKVLVATDVAARGIDVDDVTHVVNIDVPDDPEQYVHRIGRTGRAGNSGVAVTLVSWQDITKWKVINKALNLSFPDPVESYSTSPHLLADLGIPEGIKGRLPGSEERSAEREDDRSRDRSRGRSRGRNRDEEAPADEAPRPKRERGPKRTRRIRRANGEVIVRAPKGDKE